MPVSVLQQAILLLLPGPEESGGYGARHVQGHGLPALTQVRRQSLMLQGEDQITLFIS